MAEFLTLREAARRLRIHPQTLRNWIANGVIVAYRPNPNGKIYVRLSDINEVRRRRI